MGDQQKTDFEQITKGKLLLFPHKLFNFHYEYCLRWIKPPYLIITIV